MNKSAAKHGRAAIALVALVIASLVGSACAQPGAQGPSGGSKDPLKFAAFFDLSVIFTVSLSTTSIDCIWLAWAARMAVLLGSCSRFQLNCTALAS